ncbi:PREDICTED: 39S ribosomal protein L34, mitochondrial [Trachymyrmex septentrionalis]|uniref:39S ribosomal protein L34, mitochondrial n=1 Tax=Trachymyrmex septentrionalis TaxID=34720 RepID=UPI00084EE3D9|nr:PREDICTED: 39S ribosomal protein L34, mitochondrial [Trachymyrmex septentrionalis]
MFGKLISGIFQSLPRASNQLSSTATATSVWSPWGLTFVRNRMRYHFPHPSERKRIKKHGWFARLSTPNGRKILQRRILKGKHVLSH